VAAPRRDLTPGAAFLSVPGPGPRSSPLGYDAPGSAPKRPDDLRGRPPEQVHPGEEMAMVPIMSLWIPIFLSAVLVFVASSVIHMLLRYHKNNFRRLPAEDDVMEALRRFGIPPGEYMMPFIGGPAQMKDPGFSAKLKQGPVGMFTVLPSGSLAMGQSLVLWFFYCVAVGIFAAYVAGRALPPGSPYPAVFRFAGATAFGGYALALWQDSIWFKRAWTTTLKFTFDGLVYGLLTGGTFAALWPR
jgi:hypothetical protein